MGKILILKGADFSKNALSQTSVPDAPSGGNLVTGFQQGFYSSDNGLYKEDRNWRCTNKIKGSRSSVYNCTINKLSTLSCRVLFWADGSYVSNTTIDILKGIVMAEGANTFAINVKGVDDQTLNSLQITRV